MITSVSVKNYRGIKSCKVENLKNVNVFIGRNNSGKSSFLESLYLASAAFSFEEKLFNDKINNKIDYLLNRRCFRNYTWDTAKEVLWYEYNTDVPISANIKINSKNLEIKLVNWFQYPVLKFEINECTHKYINLRSPHLLDITSKSFVTITPDSKSQFVKIYEKEIKFFSNARFIDDTLLREMDIVEKRLWNSLLKKRYDKLVVEVLREGYEVEVEDLTYTTYDDGKTYQLAVKLPWTSLRVDDLGDGARYAILLIMVAALSKDTILLIEEPENHQHPAGLLRTLKMFLHLVKKNNIQTFITTHSLEFIKLLQKTAEDKKVDVGVYFFEREKDGSIDVREITRENMEVLEKLGLDPRFLDLI